MCFTNSQGQWFTRRCRKCDTLLQIYIRGRYTLLCFIQGIIFELHITLFPKACLFEENYFYILHWGGNPGFPPFTRTNRAYKLEGVEKGFLRGSLPIKMHMMHSVIILKLSMFVMAQSPLHSLSKLELWPRYVQPDVPFPFGLRTTLASKGLWFRFPVADSQWPNHMCSLLLVLSCLQENK